ncbi:hypothetical protein N4P33_20330, partial [Streptomyces sp. 15-116A]|uniref:hypothetical protein n=1 Tax=Streptomyces sp. 15-116A TaxID=2259035 RepID=UPI0021B3B0A4
PAQHAAGAPAAFAGPSAADGRRHGSGARFLASPVSGAGRGGATAIRSASGFQTWLATEQDVGARCAEGRLGAQAGAVVEGDVAGAAIPVDGGFRLGP